MKVTVLVLFLGVSLTAGASLRDIFSKYGLLEVPSGYNYHEKFGIPAAAALKAAEEAQDFDGSRIAGGNLAFNGDIPHMGGLAIILQSGFTTICGSSLISNTKLVGAASCWWDGVHRGHTMTVVLGHNMIYFGGTRIATNEVTVHPNWNPFHGVENNLSIITIRRVEFNNIIRAIALPSGAQLNDNFAGSVGRTAGFGMLADVDLGIGTNNFLYMADLPVLTNAECSRYFSNLPAQVMCTSGAGGRSICRGDFGSPLALSISGQNTLIGVASFISQYGCTVGRPAGFTRVGPHVNWIRSQL